MPALTVPEPQGLTLRDVRVDVPGRSLLDVPHLSLTHGQSVAVCGASGAGKSTLLHALAGLLRPQAGAVIWGQTDLCRLTEDGRTRFRRQHIGMIFQDFLLFDELDALHNADIASAFAARADRPARQRAARDWLTRLGLAQTGARRVDHFSGGERQRIAVARALVGAPSILLADEPTASLDRATADRLITDLLAVAQDHRRTLIAVTHDASLIARMDRVLRLHDGRIVEDSHG